jgi:hypothetical protein
VAHDHLMRSALSAAARGMHVFPLRPRTKVPAVHDWERRATTDVERIERWWNRAPYNIGVATGPSRLLVVDLDAPKPSQMQTLHGRAVFAELARKAGTVLPIETLTVVTAGGGQHLYFRAPAGVALTNTAGRLGMNIDTRAFGVVAAVGVSSRASVLIEALRTAMRRARSAPACVWFLRAADVAGATDVGRRR